MDSPRSALQKTILVLLAVMAVAFGILTAVSRGRPGVSFRDALLYLSHEGDTTVYTGKVHGDRVTVAVTPDGSAADVDFTVAGELVHACRVEYPEGTITDADGDTFPRVEILRDGETLFRGGYNPYQSDFQMLFDEDGSWHVGIAVYSGNEPREQDFDEFDIFCFARGPALSRRGSWPAWAFAAFLLSGLTALDAAFPRALFYWRNHWSVKDPEPTEFYIAMQKVGWVIGIIVTLCFYIWGVRLIE